jgi:hypothetical protein
MLSENQWNKISSYCRSKVVSLFDPAIIAVPDSKLRVETNMPHKGFYIGVVDPEGKELSRSGFLKESQNIFDSADIAVQQTFNDLKLTGITISNVQTSTFFFTLVTDVIYMPDPMQWQEDSDGVYFMWGQDYRGLYLPYQIKRLGVSKVEVMDRLCTWEAGVCSNLWRLPCGLVWRLPCHTRSS